MAHVLQSTHMWKSNGLLGLQSVLLYSRIAIRGVVLAPELDGTINTVVLGWLVGDRIAIVPE